MAPLPDHRPRSTSLGSLESEVLTLLWQMNSMTPQVVTATHIHEKMLTDPDREIAYGTVMTVLRRLEKKGWVAGEKQRRVVCWQPLVSQQEAQILQAHQQLQQFLSVGNPDVVAAFADSLDAESLDQLEAIAQRIQAVRKAREADECTSE
ncbi:MAG: BlaI/MecI/CopY family transcriptional regulator [Elainellaceae cyanobacterium]